MCRFSLKSVGQNLLNYAKTIILLPGSREWVTMATVGLKKSKISGKSFILKVLWMCKVSPKSVRSYFPNLGQNLNFPWLWLLRHNHIWNNWTHFVTTKLNYARQVYYRISLGKHAGVPLLIDSTVAFPYLASVNWGRASGCLNRSLSAITYWLDRSFSLPCKFAFEGFSDICI